MSSRAVRAVTQPVLGRGRQESKQKLEIMMSIMELASVQGGCAALRAQ